MIWSPHATAPVRHLRSASLWPFVLLGSLPFLLPQHRNPIPSFHQEWWTMMLGLVAALPLLSRHYRQHLAIPRIAWLPGTLAGLIVLQMAASPGAGKEASLLGVLYLLWAILLMAITPAMRAVHGEKAVANGLALGIAIGALASAVIVAMQWQGIRLEPWISTPPTARLFGNINQPNHLALQLWLGIAALIYLHASGKVRGVGAATAITLLASASLLSGSRALWLYAGTLPLLGLLMQQRIPGRTTSVGLAGLALLVVVAGKLGLTLLSSGVSDSFGSVVAPDAWIQPGSDVIRGGLWWQGARMGLENPLLGIGWGQFSSASFSRLEHFQTLAPETLRLVPGEHAHNISLHLLAELGLPGMFALLALGFAWAKRVWQNPVAPSGEFAIFLLALLLLHAQLEYTLWYSYFLGIAAIALALTDPRPIPLPHFRASPLALVLAGAILLMAMLRTDYLRLEQALYWREMKTSPTPRWETVLEELVDLRHRSQYGRYVDLAMIGAMAVDRQSLPDKTRLCAQGIAFSPADYVVFKCAALLALEGRAAEAHALFSKGLAAYPEQSPGLARELASMIRQYPELAPLVKTAREVMPNAPALP